MKLKEVRNIATRRIEDQRGKARDRRIRKQKLLWRFGDGTTCPCVHCNIELTFETLTQDRINAAGGYGMANLQPSCLKCNEQRSNSERTPFIPLGRTEQ